MDHKTYFHQKETRPNNKFFDPDGKWSVFNNSQLRDKIQGFAKFPIKSDLQMGKPRLLIVSVDIAEGQTLVFDSYKKADGTTKTEYRKTGKVCKISQNNDENPVQIVIKYPDGFKLEHLISNGTLSEFFSCWIQGPPT